MTPKKDSDKLDELLINVAVIKDTVEDIKGDVGNLQKVIYVGNGKPSLLTRIELVEVHLDELKWYKRAAVVGIFTGVISIIVAALV